jgi:tRNA threonylcarbamoyladenosine biosynthesis protein TsaB
MQLLGIETATEACSAALWLDGEVHSRFEIAPRRHAQLILPMMQELLDEAGLALADMDALAFGRGPGAFTGLRIAAGIVQGAALAADIPVVPVSTLASVAQQSFENLGAERVLVANDARMGEVYAGYFCCDAEGLAYAVGDEAVVHPEVLPLEDGRWLGVGSGFAAYREVLTQRLEMNLIDVQPDIWPDARYLMRLAVAGFAKGDAVAPEDALPVYLRDDVADKPRPR